MSPTPFQSLRSIPTRIFRRGIHVVRRLRDRFLAEIDLRRVERIRRFPPELLRNLPALESLVIDLGLYPCDALSLEEFPESLWPRCDQGLRLWQYPNQFARCLAELSRHPIRSYLEIGVARGGTLVTMVEYLKRFNPDLSAVGIDPCPMSDLLRAYGHSNPNVRYVRDLSCHLPKHFDWENTFFDLVLIDGYHDEPVSWADFQMVRDRTNLILFHDITNDRVPGVGLSWERCKREEAGHFEFLEFTEQYSEVRAKTGRRFLGMGLAKRKVWIS